MTYFLGKNKIFYAAIAVLILVGVIGSLNRPISVAEPDVSKDQSNTLKGSAEQPTSTS